MGCSGLLNQEAALVRCLFWANYGQTPLAGLWGQRPFATAQPVAGAQRARRTGLPSFPWDFARPGKWGFRPSE